MSAKDINNIEKAKEIAQMVCLSTPIYDKVNIKNLPFISHPLINSIHFIEDGKFVLITSENEQELKQKIFDKLIANAEDIRTILYRLNKPYWITFLSMFKDLMSNDEFSETLGDVWTTMEFPNQEKNDILISLFKDANQKKLMENDEYETYKKLPDNLYVYRGIQGKDAKIKGLSWTINKKKAI